MPRGHDEIRRSAVVRARVDLLWEVQRCLRFPLGAVKLDVSHPSALWNAEESRDSD